MVGASEPTLRWIRRRYASHVAWRRVMGVEIEGLGRPGGHLRRVARQMADQDVGIEELGQRRRSARAARVWRRTSSHGSKLGKLSAIPGGKRP